MIFIALPIVVSIFSLAFAAFLIGVIKKAPSGSGRQVGVAKAIREGAIAFLKRQYKTCGIVGVLLFFLLWLALGPGVAFGFLVGALASALAGLIGMMVSTQTNLKVAEAAKSGLKPAFDLSFKGGSVTGFLVVGLGLLVVYGLYLVFEDLEMLIAVGLGGSLISVFARLGGGIYTKAADIGADLVGKIEKAIPEDDPRNPAVIADQVGDNVGDCAGMAADLFETYVVTMVATMVLASLIFPYPPTAVILPIYLAAVAIAASILSTHFVRLKKTESPTRALFRGLVIAGILSAVGFYPIICEAAHTLGTAPLNLYLPAVIGLLIAAGMFFITDFFTSEKHWPVRSIARASQAGHGPNIINGLAVGMKSSIWPVLLISLGIMISFNLAGIYGLAIAAVAMLSLTGLIIAVDSYGPITDNASGICEMAGLPEKARKNTEILDAVGNTAKATTKGYAVASAGLAALILFSAYTHELSNVRERVLFLLDDPMVLIGLFLGGIVTYYFAALAITAVGKTAGRVVDEARRQFRDTPGLIEGQAKPDYSKCVDIVTKAALKEMVLPALLPLIFPIFIYLILGPEAVGGLLMGSIIVGIFLAIKMTSGGAAWDNAKKYVEEGNFGGKGSFAHQAAVTGDTVGDPYKDTAGPAINPMIKVLNIVALLIVKFIMLH